MSIPMHYEFYMDVLLSLADGNPHQLSEIRDFVAKRKNISDADRALLFESSKNIRGTIFDYRVNWTRSYLKAAGLIVYPKRAVTQITDEGKKVLAENPPTIDTAYLSRYETFQTFVGRKTKDDSAESAEKV